MMDIAFLILKSGAKSSLFPPKIRLVLQSIPQFVCLIVLVGQELSGYVRGPAAGSGMAGGH